MCFHHQCCENALSEGRRLDLTNSQHLEKYTWSLSIPWTPVRPSCLGRRVGQEVAAFGSSWRRELAEEDAKDAKQVMLRKGLSLLLGRSETVETLWKLQW